VINYSLNGGEQQTVKNKNLNGGKLKFNTVEQEFKWKGTTTCRERRKKVNIHEKNLLKT
jgi:hypothetical protein